jgi:hypothetical protein
MFIFLFSLPTFTQGHQEAVWTHCHSGCIQGHPCENNDRCLELGHKHRLIFSCLILCYLKMIVMSVNLPWRRFGAWGIAPRILNLATGWRWVISSRSGCFTSEERSPPPRYLLYRRLGGPQSGSGHSGAEREVIIYLCIKSFWHIK